MTRFAVFVLAALALFISASYGYYMFARSVDGDLDIVATISMLEAVGCAMIMVAAR